MKWLFVVFSWFSGVYRSPMTESVRMVPLYVYAPWFTSLFVGSTELPTPISASWTAGEFGWVPRIYTICSSRESNAMREKTRVKCGPLWLFLEPVILLGRPSNSSLIVTSKFKRHGKRNSRLLSAKTLLLEVSLNLLLLNRRFCPTIVLRRLLKGWQDVRIQLLAAN